MKPAECFYFSAALSSCANICLKEAFNFVCIMTDSDTHTRVHTHTHARIATGHFYVVCAHVHTPVVRGHVCIHLSLMYSDVGPQCKLQ